MSPTLTDESAAATEQSLPQGGGPGDSQDAPAPMIGPTRAAAIAVLLMLAVMVAAPPASVLGRVTGRVLKAADATPAATTPSAAVVTSSAVTTSGTGPFAALKVTVGQTKDLINQTVSVTWTGGAPTPTAGVFTSNYLQIMQCWAADSDGTAGPDRKHCQFGGRNATDSRGGASSASRRLDLASYFDDKEPLLKTAAGAKVTTQTVVPFESVTGGVIDKPNQANSFYDAYSTNEIPYARTRGDGSGFETFEMQTFREAEGLGCADLVATGANAGKPRACYLVVVPRGSTEVDGSPPTKGDTRRLDSSPLSQSNWDLRIVFPLTFVAVGKTCPIASAQVPVVGVGSFSEAIGRWQATLCANNGPVFGFSQVVDSNAERGLVDTSSSPGLAFLNGPVAVAIPSDRILVYAPVALSGLAISALVEQQSAPTAADDVKKTDGERITDIQLNQRLVAKLLTQSYRRGALLNASYLNANPESLSKDKEFLDLNPRFKTLTFDATEDILVPIGNALTNRLLWQWIETDDDAVNFVNGLPDPNGMRVNPFYQGLDTNIDNFPKKDPFCDKYFAIDAPPLCSLDVHQYVQDFNEAARSAARGDSLSRNLWDPQGTPPAYRKVPLQLSGQRDGYALSDTATAARYGLVTVKLRNGAGKYVAPTAASLTSALAAMRPSSVSGVLEADPGSPRADAYPLPLLTYAVTAPGKLSATEAKQYGQLVRYAAGAGQVPGQAPGTLPDGYVPLTTTLKTQAIAVAKQIEARVGPKATAASIPKVTKKATTPAKGSSGKPAGKPGPQAPAAGPAPVPAAPPAVPAGPAGTTTAPPSTDAAASTPSPQVNAAGLAPANTSQLAEPDDVGATRYVLVFALVLGVAGLLFGPAVPRLTRRLVQ